SPGGKISDGQRKTDLRAVGSIKDTSQFLDIAVGQRGGVPLYVKNIATIEDTTEELATVTKLNDMPALGLDVMKQSGSNTVQVVDNVKKQ
ncbi:efflux RND transporter permease subunit, partial [Klebsiella pneumoniae]|nr:efflux RND transporter permease subunit [Klebsiella pneumoniae]